MTPKAGPIPALHNTGATNAGVERLRRALPTCEIHHSAKKKPTPDEAIAAIERLGGKVTVDGNEAVVAVDLLGTQVTDAGLKNLQQALPNCKIDR